MAILYYLQLVINEMQNVMDNLTKHVRSVYVPHPELSVYETMLKFKGQLG